MIRLEGPDAAFLYAETPEWHFHVTGLVLLDPGDGWSPDRMRRLLLDRIHEIPQLRWKLHTDPTGMSRPTMADDPDFDVDNHLRRATLPEPGDERTLGACAGEIVARKIDRSGPLWELWMIDGLADGGVAVLTKIHHSIIDGVSGTDLFARLFDLEREPGPDPPPPPYRPESIAPRASRAVDGIAQVLTLPVRAARFGWQLVGQGRALAASLVDGVTPSQPFRAPRTSLNGALTPRRDLAWTSVPFADVARVGQAFDVTTNDVVLAMVSGVLRRHLSARGELPHQPLIAQVPMSVRTEETRDRVGSQVAAMFASLATDVDDPGARVRAIAESTRDSKIVRRALNEHRTESLTNTVTPALMQVAARAWTMARLDSRARPVFNLIVSNVPGPPVDLFMAGGRVEAMYPLGPLIAGTGVNITVISQADRLDLGFLGCPDRVPDLWELADLVGPSLDEILAAAALYG